MLRTPETGEKGQDSQRSPGICHSIAKPGLKKVQYKKSTKKYVVAQAYSHNMWEAEAGGL
jgi:hypothetical protein